MLNLIYFKDAGDSIVSVPIERQAGETIQTLTLGSVSPITASPLLVSQLTFPPDELTLSLKGGVQGTSYGVSLTVATNVRSFVVSLGITVGTSEFQPYKAVDPNSFSELLGVLDAGAAALSTVIFPFPPGIDPSGGHVIWELLNEEGAVFSSGNAFAYSVITNGITTTVKAQSIITTPSNIPPSPEAPYILRYTLTLPAIVGEQEKYYSYESLRITGLADVPLGVPDLVEFKGDNAVVSLVVSELYSTVEVSLLSDDTVLGTLQVKDAERVAAGYRYTAQFSTANLPVNLEPYVVVWKYRQASQLQSFRESGRLWVVNSSLLSAVEDVRAKVNKAQQTLYGMADMQFPVETIMLWLRRARDAFNSTYGVFTSFTMLNAKGAIREYWLMYAEMFAIEAQYLAEGESAFNYQGANISLDVDRTGFLDSAASKIQSRLDNEFKNVKQVMVMRGATSGDGSVDPARLQKGAIGAVGVSIHPAITPGILAYGNTLKR
jgi:hypothetical protein